jgi:hypothetical protein
MSKNFRSRIGIAAAAATLGIAMPLLAHHSFAAFDMNKTVIMTGVVQRVNPDANHLQIFFTPLNAERTGGEKDKNGEYIVYSVEMAGSAASAGDGISVNSFPRGTVFSVGVHPQRNGDPSGFREGPLFKCPPNPKSTTTPQKPLPPAAGKHCDSVEGRTQLGQGRLATAN